MFRISLLVCLSMCNLCYSIEAGDLFHLCPRKDIRTPECVIESLNKLKPLLRKGIPALRIPKLEPMVVPEISLKQGAGPVQMDSTFINLKISGITNFKIEEIEPDFDDYSLNFTAKLPYLYTEGMYMIKGRILTLPIVGNGNSWSNYTGVTAKGMLIGAQYQKAGKPFMRVKKFDFDVDVKNAKIQMYDLFDGNEELGKAMNQVLNENWEIVYRELKPIVDTAVSKLLTDVATKVFDKFPYDELFVS